MSRAGYITAVLVACLFFWPSRVRAQSEDIPLGDLARSLRKNQPPPQTVIDNDNLPAVMEQGEDKRWAKSLSLPKPESPAAPILRISSPDVSCALDFNGKDALDENSKPRNLPADELTKLNGPATIVGNSLQLYLHNGSGWDLREVTVGFTLVHRQPDLLTQFDGVRLMPAASYTSAPSEKSPDFTVLYHMKGTAPPSATTLFQAPLDLAIGSDQEWHWAIVQAKGVPPAAPPEPATAPPQLVQAPD